MRLYVDEREISSLAPTFTSLDQIVKHVEEVHLAPNTVIRQIQVDGLPVISEQFQKDPATLLENIKKREKIEIFTGSIWDIAHDSIGEAITYLDRVESATSSLAASFQITPGPEAFENLKQLYEGFYWLNLLVDRLETTFNLSLDNVELQGATAREHHIRFASILKQLINSQEKEDFVLIADLLEYEILPLIPVWKEMFGQLVKKINAGNEDRQTVVK